MTVEDRRAVAGSTLTLEVAVQRAVNELGFAPADAVESTFAFRGHHA